MATWFVDVVMTAVGAATVLTFARLAITLNTWPFRVLAGALALAVAVALIRFWVRVSGLPAAARARRRRR